MSNISTELQEIIRKNLPEEVGANLKQYLAECEVKIAELAEAKKYLEQYTKKIERLEKELDELNKLSITKSSLDKREEELNKKEQTMELTIMQVKLEQAEKRADAVTGVVNQVFKSKVYTAFMSENIGGSQLWNGMKQGNEFVANGSNSKTETRTEE